MRRDTFLKSMATLAAAGSLPLLARAAEANVKMMIPANPGGGWDTTGRALGKALQDSGAAATVTYDNKGGAAGALGLAQGTAGGVPAAAGVGRNHHLHVRGGTRPERPDRGRGQRGQRSQESVTAHGNPFIAIEENGNDVRG